MLILRLLYVEKRESLSTSEDRVFVTVEEIKNEYEKLSLPRKFDKVFLEERQCVYLSWRLSQQIKAGNIEKDI